jgi:hypothetical protein
MTKQEIKTECIRHAEFLKSLKSLAYKYDQTELELSDEEWRIIKTYRIDKRQWLGLVGYDSDKYYDQQIATMQNIIKSFELPKELKACLTE